MNQLKYTLYFIPECSKCRGSLNLLEKFDENLLKKINYVENPPNEEELKKISSIIDGNSTKK
ncbi:hypothetical protein HDU92_005805 [Lobulomyces angularis]|nr:hypothetical protein HDU92_005805 [Lobulomyces angularis]